MTPSDFPQANLTLAKPAGMTDEQCKPLRVHTTGAEFVSCWRLTWRERLAILFGRPLWLWIVGRGHPPVMLSVENPWPGDAP